MGKRMVMSVGEDDILPTSKRQLTCSWRALMNTSCIPQDCRGKV